MNRQIPDVLGACLGIRFVERGEEDNHILLKFLVEDDENWHEKELKISSYWLDDLIDVCERAKKRLKQEAIEDPNGWGYSFEPYEDD